MKAQEIWKPVVGYEGLYMVSDLGRVKSVPRKGTKGGIMKPSPDIWGYLQVCLSKNGKQETCRVHQLVMRAFVGECPENHQVDHINFKQDDNRFENLRYLPAKENNSRHSPEGQKNISEASKKRAANQEWQKKNAEKNKKLAQDPEWMKNHAEAMQKLAQDPEWQRKHTEGTRKARCKPVDQYTIDGQLIKRWPSATDAARELGLNQGYISACCRGECNKANGFRWRFAD